MAKINKNYLSIKEELAEKDKELLQELSRDASLENKDFSEEGHNMKG